jgi:hypothetical protein
MMTLIKKLSPLRNKRQKRKSHAPVTYPFSISNAEQEAYLASHKKRTLQLLPPIVIARNPKPNSSESHQPRIVFHDEIPDFRLPVFRYLKFDRRK